MFQTFGFIVHFPPFHAEHFRQHSLNQVMPQGQPARDAPTGRREPNPPSACTCTRRSFFRRRTAMVTAGGDTFSQCARVAEITVSPSLSASRIAFSNPLLRQ